ncbi:MAG: type II secretion system protein GspD [Limisphaerales bacterium]|nr:MAG: type II secretion system protein GspD [Limisphaerales bacterium]
MNFKIKTISEGIHNSSKFLIIILIFGALIFGAGCRSPKKSNNTFSLNDRVKYNASYDEELDSIFNLSEKGKWEEAEAEISLLLQEHPEDPVLQRISEWVTTQKTLLRQQAIEDRIRSVNARQTGMNPTLKELWNESKDRGLPPRKDLRDALEMIEATPYVPETFGKKVTKKGFLFDAQSEKGRMFELLKTKVSIEVENLSIQQILFELGKKEDINFVADQEMKPLQQKLTLKLNDVPLNELLEYIARNTGVKFQVGDELIWVIDGKASKELIEETRFYRLRKGFIVPAQFGPDETISVTTTPAEGPSVTRETTTYQKFVNDSKSQNPSISEAIEKFFKGEFMIDYERNLIVATGTPSQFELLEKIIDEFDRAIQQVLIEARFITISEAAFLDLGFRWASSIGKGAVKDQTGISQGNISSQEGMITRITLKNVFDNDSILENADLTAVLSALEQSGESQLLSSPRLTLLNNRPGKINDGEVNYYYEQFAIEEKFLGNENNFSTSARLVPTGKPSKITAGVSLDVVASIGGDGQSILLALHPVVNQNVSYVSLDGQTVDQLDETDNNQMQIFLPKWRTQELSTRVVVGSGQSIMMGGVLQREQRTVVESVPILGNIPGLGAFFRKRATLDKPRYLLIFVTATLIDEDGSFITYEKPEAGLPVPVRVPAGLKSSSSSAFPVSPQPSIEANSPKTNPPSPQQ